LLELQKEFVLDTTIQETQETSPPKLLYLE